MDSGAGPSSSSGKLGDLLRKKYIDKAEEGEIQTDENEGRRSRSRTRSWSRRRRSSSSSSSSSGTSRKLESIFNKI